jgi:hypothetical protein
MSSPSKGSPPKSPVRAVRKKNAFMKNNPYMKKPASEIKGNMIKIIAVKGDEEIMFVHKGNDESVDTYVLNVKKDIEDHLEPVMEMHLSACLPRRVSKDNNLVALSRGKWFKLYINIYISV